MTSRRLAVLSVLAILVWCAMTLAVLAADPAVPDQAPPSGAAAAAATAPQDAVAASAAAAPEMVPDPLGPLPSDDPKNVAYAHGGYALSIFGTFFSLLVLWLMVSTGFGAWLQDLAEKVTMRPNLKVAVYAVLFVIANFIVSLPLSIYEGFIREKKFGFMNQSFAAYMGDQGKGLMVGIILQAIFLPLLYLVIRKMGRSWWVPGAALTIIFLIVVIVIAPVFISPLFNKFEPLKDQALKESILTMAHQQGIPAHEVYQVDASRQSEHNNAYVTGLFGTQRIVLYDTILKRFNASEIKMVMGHEMGHYVLHHIWKTVALLAVIVVIGFLFVDRTARKLIARHPAYGIRAFEEPSSLPLVLLLLSLFSFVVQPVTSSFSRAHEHEADVFGLELTRNPEAAASVFLKFGKYDLSEINVNPWIEFWLFSHPSVGHRVEYVKSWAKAHPEAVSPKGLGAGPGDNTR